MQVHSSYNIAGTYLIKILKNKDIFIIKILSGVPKVSL